MKKAILFILAFTLICLGAGFALAGSIAWPVAVDAINFPDPAFRDRVNIQFAGGDNHLTQDEAEAVKTMYVTSLNIADLKGLEYFTKLENINCSNNKLQSIDLSKNTALTSLDCSNNSLTALDLSKNISLGVLNCQYNQLANIDLSKNLGLARISINNNKLSQLDLSKNPLMFFLNAQNNQLTNVALAEQFNFDRLYLHNNQLISLDIKKVEQPNWQSETKASNQVRTVIVTKVKNSQIPASIDLKTVDSKFNSNLVVDIVKTGNFTFSNGIVTNVKTGDVLKYNYKHRPDNQGPYPPMNVTINFIVKEVDPPPVPSTPSAPKTGDSTPIALLLVLAAFAGISIFYLIKRKVHK